MSWDDINFGLIVPGMITRGPATVSFADYLNQFSRALDERMNMLIKTPDGSYPTLPNITFEVGEIRTNGGEFWVKLQEMIADYYNIWNSYDWYSVDLMTDPVNHADYLLDDSDLIAIISQETFDIISDVDTKFVLEYFTAKVINALYEIYKLTQYTRVSVESIRLPSDAARWGTTSVNLLENTGSAGGGNFGESEPSFGPANSIAHGRYGTDYGIASSNLSSLIIDISNQTLGIDGVPDSWEVSYSQLANGVSLHSRYRDLDEVLLDMEIATITGISFNYRSLSIDQAPATFPGVYDNRFDQVLSGDLEDRYNSGPLHLSTIHQQPFGTVNSWAGNGGTYNNPTLPKSISSVGLGGNSEIFEQHRFSARIFNDVATNINNAGLEFFIG